MRLAMLALLPAFLVPAAATDPSMFDGRPTFAEGESLAYYIWRDGDMWHVRWTTQGKLRSFSGSVEAEGGRFKTFRRIDVESETRIIYPGRPARVTMGPRGRVRRRGGAPAVVQTKTQDHIARDGDSRIVFNTKTNDDIDGFDFSIDDVRSLRFVLHVDGKEMPNFVEFGRDNKKPHQLPLIVNLR